MKKSKINKINHKTTRVENFDGVLQYMCEDFKKSIRLTSYMKDKLTNIFGKHNTRYKGEFHYYVWIIEFENEIFEIFTADVKGTAFVIVFEDFDDDNRGVKSDVCIRFLEEIDKLLIEHE